MNRMCLAHCLCYCTIKLFCQTVSANINDDDDDDDDRPNRCADSAALTTPVMSFAYLLWSF